MGTVGAFPCSSSALALVLAPLLPGIINRVKAVVAGRRGQPLLQPYYDIAKLLVKGAVYSRTTTWVFRAGPVAGMRRGHRWRSASFPGRAAPALLSFDGDIVLFAGLFGLMRFLTILAALDTGSAFEGMGASREAWFSALAEPALLLALAALARHPEPFAFRDAGRLPGRRGRGAALLLAAGAVVHRLPRGERPDSRGRSDHAPGAHDDPRGDGARPRRHRPGLHPVRRRVEAVGAGRAGRVHPAAADRAVDGGPGDRPGRDRRAWASRPGRWNPSSRGCGWPACRSSWWRPWRWRRSPLRWRW